MAKNYIHEGAHAVYLRHVYNNTVAEIFLGDELFGTDGTVPIEERVDKAVKRVQKLSAATKAAVGLIGRGGGLPLKRDRGREPFHVGYNGVRPDYQRQRESYYERPFFPRGGASTVSLVTMREVGATLAAVNVLVGYVGHQGTSPSNALRHHESISA